MRHVALLRAVNVGGTGQVTMTALRELCRAAGFIDVRTYIASGNVVLRSPLGEDGIRDALESRLKSRFGKTSPVLVRSGAEMAAILAANPFAGEDPRKTYVLFLGAPPEDGALARARNANGERLGLGTREIYIHYPAGMGRSRLVLPAMAVGTARNMKTVARLAEMSAAP